MTLAEITEEGKHFDLVADEPTRAAVARLAGLRSLTRMQASLDVARHAAGGLHVRGTVSATVGQNCVVTLEPLDNELNEEIDIVFAPPGSSFFETDEEDEEAADAIGLDGPEPLIGDGVDLGMLAVEFLMLGIDPYPRKPGVTFEAPAAGDDAADKPFASLAALKKRTEGQE